jgi:hypothetical protein
MYHACHAVYAYWCPILACLGLLLCICLLVMLTVMLCHYLDTCAASGVLLYLVHDPIDPLDHQILMVSVSILLGCCSSLGLDTPDLAGCQMINL